MTINTVCSQCSKKEKKNTHTNLTIKKVVKFLLFEIVIEDSACD